MAQPLVSVIIPTYGRPQYLMAAVESVLVQTHGPIELVVVDDCSPEPVTVEANDAVAIKVVRHSRNMGPGAARNTGLAHATGTFVTFLDDDDTFAPDRLAAGVTSIGDARMHWCATNLPERRCDGDMRATLHHEMPPSITQVMFRREDVLQFDPTLRVSEDVEWWVRMRDRAIFASSESVGLYIRAHHGERPGVDPKVRAACRLAVLRRHHQELDRRSRIMHLNRAASSLLAAGCGLRAACLGARSLATVPNWLAVKIVIRGLTGRD